MEIDIANIPETAQLGFNSTVPRAWVHRRAVHEVFITDSLALSPDRILCTAQLPKIHDYFNDHTLHHPKYDTLLLIEVFRQAQFVACHRYIGVPMGNKFIFVDGDIELADPEAVDIGEAPGHALIDLNITDRRHREDTLVGIVLELRLSIDGRDAATMGMTVRWMPSAIWHDLRRRCRADLALATTIAPVPAEPVATIDPAMVGRRLQKNVVLASVDWRAGEVRGVIGIDRQHSSLFDHPLDHIPGMLLLETYRQVAIATAHHQWGIAPGRMLMTRCAADFLRFGELELTTHFRVSANSVRANPTKGSLEMGIDILQKDQVISRARVTVCNLCQHGPARPLAQSAVA